MALASPTLSAMAFSASLLMSFAAASPSSGTTTTPATIAPSPSSIATQGDTSGSAQASKGITLVQFFTALASGLVIFAIQIILFLLLRNKLARIFKPKTFLVTNRERTDSPPASIFGLLRALFNCRDREIINKCGLDAYFFDRYLKTLLVIFIPMALVITPILLPINYVGGLGKSLVKSNATVVESVRNITAVTGLDTLAWGNVSPAKIDRYWAHLILAICVVFWVCVVFFLEMRVYIKIRQDYLTSAEHRLRASATTVMVNNIPAKWLTKAALHGLFDVFPGGTRNIWLNRDLTRLLNKIKDRDNVHQILEQAETELIKKAKKRQLNRKVAEDKKRRRDLSIAAESKEEKVKRKGQEDLKAHSFAQGKGISSGIHEEVPHTVDDVVSGDSKRQVRVQPARHLSRNAMPNIPEDNHDGPSRHPLDERYDGQLDGSDGAGSPESNDMDQGRFKSFKMSKFTDPITKAGQGIRSGVEKAGQGIIGLGAGAESAIMPSSGFIPIPDSDSSIAAGRRIQIVTKPGRSRVDSRPSSATGTRPTDRATVLTPGKRGRADSGSSRGSTSSSPDRKRPGTAHSTSMVGSKVRKLTDVSSLYAQGDTKFWQFWKAPSGAYVSPIPQQAAVDDESLASGGGSRAGDSEETDGMSIWRKVWEAMPWTSNPVAAFEYPPDHNPNYMEDKAAPAEWERWLQREDRPTYRLPILGVLPGFPLVSKKVDTIYWCRTELARLNMEIQEDQKHPERYPLMNSAFIQFNQQVAAHMACQSLTHHLPKKMSPREIEISPRDVIWDNMALSWWQTWIRSVLTIAFIVAMVVFWAIPIGWTAAFSQIDTLTKTLPWLAWINDHQTVRGVAVAIAGVLPAAVLSLLLFLVPVIFYFLASVSGCKTRPEKEEFVQVHYFLFLFVQVFLVVSITSFFAASVEELFRNIQAIQTIPDVLDILARNLPAAANYFFSYMVLQALSTSSGTLLQVGALLTWFVIARMFDTTARNKWNRNVQLSQISWGSFFPVYTNFACIALIYSIIAPLIVIFAVVTFGLLWIAQRYSTLYVIRFQNDTGGVLYPRAINQTFTGLYVMQLCLIGLFSIERKLDGSAACTTQATIMAVVLVLTVGFQILLNMSFAPLFRYLPITCEDEAVLRDQAFQRAQDIRLGLLAPKQNKNEDVDEEETEAGDGDGAEDGDGDGNEDGGEVPPASELAYELETEDDSAPPSLSDHHDLGAGKAPGEASESIELSKMQRARRQAKLVGVWARAGSSHHNHSHHNKKVKQRQAVGYGSGPTSRIAQAVLYRAQRRQRDVEAQKAMGEALYGGVHDEIEDLAPEERDTLVQHAFQHYALRARCPTVWLPRDDLGISDDEVARTRDFSEHIWISNAGTALDSKVRVVFGCAPPDFSEMDVINL